MSVNVHVAATVISASTATASGALANSSAKYIRVVNGSSALCYVNAGGSGVTATSANPAVRPNGEYIFERRPDSDTHIAVLLSAGTGTVSAHPCSQAE